LTNTPLRIATRRSKLAMWQAEHVQSLLREAHPDLPVELVPMSTQGDRVLDRALAEVGGKGLFVKELEVAMLEGRADFAVHSMKDVPSELPAGFAIVAVLPRANPLDAFISLRYRRFADLPQGARVGTSSPRRQSQLRQARPDLRLELLRGNVDTRLRRLDEGELDAILLACAGLERLGIAHHVTEQLDMGLSLPAVGQGVIGIECRADDTRSRAALAALHHPESFTQLSAERAFAAKLGGSCHSPIAAHASLDGGTLTVRGYIGAPDGSETYRDQVSGPAAEAERLGRELAGRMQAAGAETLLERLRQQAAAAP
jgi:hydroxymethylbilane synthase